MTGTGNLLQRAIPRLYLAASGTVTNDSVSDVLDSAQEVTKDTANEVNQFVQYFYDHIPNLIAFGMKVLFAIIFFLIGRKVIKWIRKIVSRSMERANADVGVKQFVDSMLKFVMYAVLIFLIATKFGVESSSVAALIASAGVAIGLAVQGSLSNFAGGILILILKPFEVKIDKDQKTYFYNIYNDTIKAELTIYKTDSETGKRIPAAGVEFKIKDADGNYVTQTVTYPKKYTTDVFKTDEDGSVHLPAPLKYGEYKLVEIKAPHGYVLKDTEIPINVDGSSTEIFMNFDNKTQKGQVYVEKSGEMLSGAKESETDYGTLYSPVYKEKYLSGVTYEITAREDIVTPEGTVWFHKGDVVDTFTTGDGVTTSSLLQLGKYSIKETTTQTGYVLDENSYNFDIEYAGQMIDVVEIKQSYVNERQKLDLQITKTFEDEDKEAYKDVVFGVYSKKDITVDDKVIIPADGLVGTLTIDKDGKNVEHLDLPTGDYYVKELETNVGFKLDEEKHDFTFNYDEDTTKSTVIVPMELHNEKRRIELDVNKVDKDHHDHFLNGAIFEVYDKTAKSFVTTLASGQLMIVGDDANEEYEISKDEDFKKIIKTVKTDENKQIILDVDDGIYYSRKVGDDKVSKHVIKDGKAVLADAIYGHEYEFKEIKAPTSYQLADKSKAYKVEGDKDTDTIIYYFENARIVVPNTGV